MKGRLLTSAVGTARGDIQIGKKGRREGTERASLSSCDTRRAGRGGSVSFAFGRSKVRVRKDQRICMKTEQGRVDFPCNRSSSERWIPQSIYFVHSRRLIGPGIPPHSTLPHSILSFSPFAPFCSDPRCLFVLPCSRPRGPRRLRHAPHHAGLRPRPRHHAILPLRHSQGERAQIPHLNFLPDRPSALQQSDLSHSADAT